MNTVWISPERVLDRTALYRFEKTVEATKDSVISLNISADTRYKFYVNGRYVCEGPCQGDHWFWRYETVEIPRAYLKNGENILSFSVLHVKDNYFLTQARKDSPALLVFGTVNDGGVCREIATVPGWKCVVETKMHFAQAGRDINCTMPHVERVTDEPDEETNTVFCADCHVEQGNRTPYGVAEKYVLEPRSIPLLKPEKPVPFREISRVDGRCDLDAGVYTTAYPKFVFKGKRGGKIRFTYAECYSNGSRGSKGRRDEANGDIIGVYDEVELTGRKQEYIPYFFRAFRYVKAEYPEGTDFLPEKQSYSPYFYPIEEKGYVKSGDEAKNKLWEISLNTLRCCSHETFVDCPYYEQSQYDMDTSLEMMFMFRVTNDYSLARKAVYDLARSQEPDGMLCAHYPSTLRQIIPTFSLFWIHMLRDYVTYSGDVYAAKELLPVAERVLNRFDLLINEDGLVGVTDYWHYTDWVPGWKRGVPPHGDTHPLTLSSMMYSVALEKAAGLAKEVGRSALAAEYMKRRAAVNRAVNMHCYDSRRQFYVDVPGFGGLSEHTAVWAVLSGAVEGDEAVQLLERSFNSDVNRASFSFNYYTFRALEKTGLYGKYSGRLFGGWFKMKDMGCTTWCENPDDPRSECHAWSSAPIYEFSSVYLGVKPTATGFKKAVIAPDLSFGDKVSGAVPTPKGVIKVSWEKTKKNIDLNVEIPRGIKAVLQLPGHEAVELGRKNEISLLNRE